MVSNPPISETMTGFSLLLALAWIHELWLSIGWWHTSGVAPRTNQKPCGVQHLAKLEEIWLVCFYTDLGNIPSEMSGLPWYITTDCPHFSSFAPGAPLEASLIHSFDKTAVFALSPHQPPLFTCLRYLTVFVRTEPWLYLPPLSPQTWLVPQYRDQLKMLLMGVLQNGICSKLQRSDCLWRLGPRRV